MPLTYTLQIYIKLYLFCLSLFNPALWPVCVCVCKNCVIFIYFFLRFLGLFLYVFVIVSFCRYIYLYIGGSLICKALINCLQTNNDVITGYKGILIIKDCFSSFSNHMLNISVSVVFCLSLRACECHLCARTPGSARAGLW